MITLLEAAQDSERSFRESLVFTSPKTRPYISDYFEKYSKNKEEMFSAIKDISDFHLNPILKTTQGTTAGNNNTFELKKGYFLRQAEIQEFYEKGFISQKYQFPNLKKEDIQRIQKEYVEHGNKCKQGIYSSVYGRFPDYVAHLYFPSVIKLFKDNYEFIVQKAMSIFNKPEEELFFQAGIFVVDKTEKGANIHQDYSYYFLDQVSPEIKTCVLSFHTAISNKGSSRFYLYPSTHREILHNLTTLKYLLRHGIPINEDMAMYCAGISEYVIDSQRLPYNDPEGLVVTFSHFSRYPQQLYILDKYKDKDIAGYKVDTEAGEFILFDPALLHSNGASSGNIEELMKNYEGMISDEDIARLSLVIRVMHTKNDKDHFLWMAGSEKIKVLQDFLENKQKENRNSGKKIRINKNTDEFYTVLSNNKIGSSDSPYFTVNEMYQLYLESGAYE